MGQILRTDKIGALSHAGGIISLAPSILTIGGQQYVTSTLNRTISTDLTLAANTLYMIYAVVSGGVPSLKLSSNVNSIGPAGFLGWKLVGAFYSSGKASPDFGCFMTIEGKPMSIGFVDSGPLLSTVHILAAPTNPTFTTFTTNIMTWYREGRFMFPNYNFHMSTTGTAGSGAYRFVLPFAVSSEVVPTTVVAGEVGNLSTLQKSILPGLGHITNGASRGHVTPFLYDTTSFSMIADAVYGGYGVWGSSNYGMSSAQSIRINLWDVPVQGWTDTPLKDL